MVRTETLISHLHARIDRRLPHVSKRNDREYLSPLKQYLLTL